MKLSTLIPKHKSDFSTVEQLHQLSEAEIAPIAMDILEWLQDANWPIAAEMLKLIVLRQNVMLEHISTVLEGNDEMWKYWIITNVLPDLTPDNLQQLLPKLLDMHEHPTKGEIADEVHLEVRNFLYDHHYKDMHSEVSHMVMPLWAQEQLPYIDGLLLKDGRLFNNIRKLARLLNPHLLYEYISLNANNDGDDYADNFTHVNIFHVLEHDGYKIFYGETSHGSYGYILVLGAFNQFEWLLLDQINPIESITVKDNVIYAVNNCNEQFAIPIHQPEHYSIPASDQS